MALRMRKGLLITLEGPEGSGKSTHSQLLAQHLRLKGHRVLLTREPGGTSLSQVLRRLLLDPRSRLSPLSELFLYEADRAQHMAECVIPALQKGQIVLCDRFTDSTLAYQGYARRLDKRMIRTLNALATGGRAPDLTLLLDVPVRQGLRQAKQKKKIHDRLERAGTAFHERVRRGFLTLARLQPKRFRVIRQQPTIAETQKHIRGTIDTFL